jgi:hypothetical protein
MDNVQKINNCVNIPSSHIFGYYFDILRWKFRVLFHLLLWMSMKLGLSPYEMNRLRISGDNLSARGGRSNEGWRKLHNEGLQSSNRAKEMDTACSTHGRDKKIQTLVWEPGCKWQFEESMLDKRIILKWRLRNVVSKCGPDPCSTAWVPIVTISVSTRISLHGAAQFNGRKDTPVKICIGFKCFRTQSYGRRMLTPQRIYGAP